MQCYFLNFHMSCKQKIYFLIGHFQVRKGSTCYCYPKLNQIFQVNGESLKSILSRQSKTNHPRDIEITKVSFVSLNKIFSIYTTMIEPKITSLSDPTIQVPTMPDLAGKLNQILGGKMKDSSISKHSKFKVRILTRGSSFMYDVSIFTPKNIDCIYYFLKGGRSNYKRDINA